MKKIALSKGMFAVVDDEDFEYLNQWKWCYSSPGYAIRMTARPNRQSILMHRVVNNTPDGLLTDHINRNGLDNRKANLRSCTQAENAKNILKSSNKSGYTGVHWHKECKKWTAQVRQGGKKVHLGLFENIEDAAKARNKFAKKVYGQFAILNKLVN